ncbi:hypothetical protein [Burkholderia seminalis]|uniref:hypothetical protein n=1 Tax=Burkholderia seminalis TaxID=488731 RepID=UPI002656FB66|nr:hypothetical protein [Burkholderia seminalis]MDN7592102.1 hypothetical protein [Burkholderia seminalis]
MTTLRLEARGRFDDFYVTPAFLAATGQNSLAARRDVLHELANIERSVGIESDHHEVPMNDSLSTSDVISPEVSK